MSNKPTLEQLLEQQRIHIMEKGERTGNKELDVRYTPVGEVDFEIAASYTQDAIVALLTDKKDCTPNKLPTLFECYQPEILVRNTRRCHQDPKVMAEGILEWEQMPEVGYAYIYTGCEYLDYKIQVFAYYFYYNELGCQFDKQVEIANEPND